MGHTFSSILIHVIFGTKDRRPLIGDFRQRLYEYLAGVARQEFGHAIRIGGTENHLHGLLKVNTNISVADAMKKWKSLSSGWLHKSVPAASGFEWQRGYGAFSVSQSNVAGVIEYIENQAARHKALTFEEEFLTFLRRHRIEFDPGTVWEDSFGG
ncbi:MAG TPA: transposase [Phycisphaerales bacterium]|nr:transposase [Phycisphaerales bacterium]